MGAAVRWERWAQRIDGRFGWQRLPAPLGLPVLLAVQRSLAAPARAPAAARPESEADALLPNPLQISRELLAGGEFVPAAGLNVLGAAWLELMVRGWFSRGPGSRERPWRLPAEDAAGEPREFERAHRDPRHGQALAATSWWDDAPLYGADARVRAQLRAGEGGRLRAPAPGRIALADGALEQTGVWLGLTLLTQLFGLEHNAICDRLRAAHPTWSDEQLFERARRVNRALLAKIHAAEWLPAASGASALRLAARLGLWGPRGPRRRALARWAAALQRALRLPARAPRGAAPAALGEEDFAAASRLHPLLPGAFALRRAADGALLAERSLEELSGPALHGVLDAFEPADLLYSLGSAPAGALRLHGFARALLDYRHPGSGASLDLGALDVLRARELGAARYNELRRRLGRPALRGFAELCERAEWAEELRSAYRNELEQVDLLVGLCAEAPAPGSALGESALRVQLVLSLRRLRADPALADECSAEHYGEAGLEWLDRGSLAAVLQRHHPLLATALAGRGGAFAPWR